MKRLLAFLMVAGMFTFGISNYVFAQEEQAQPEQTVQQTTTQVEQTQITQPEQAPTPKASPAPNVNKSNEGVTPPEPTAMQKYGSLFFIILMVVVVWLFFMRPQAKRAKEEQKFRDSLQKGDKVVTYGGIHGKITEVKDATVMISIAPNMEVEVEKAAVYKEGTRVGQA